MSLMQVLPEFELAQGAYQGKKPVPVFVPAVKVEFRSGGDLSRVVDVLKQNRRVEVEAATGAGKSSKLPLELARGTGELVVHVVPHLLMAASIHRYRLKVSEGAQVSFLQKADEAWPTSGVVVVSAGFVVSKWLQAGRVEMPRCYVLQDESHESGFASAVMRALTSVATEVICYAAMTATHGPTGARRMEMAGTVRDQFYEPEAFEDPWSVEEDGAPWAVSGLAGHALVFEDDRRRAMTLVEAYNCNGARAYRLHAQMPVREFLGVLDAIEDDRSGVACVLVADSTFRSSHTFPVSLVVDSGLVKRVVVENGRPVRSQREIYESEAVQSKARGGRLKGLSSVYWRPRADLQARMCDLEQTDVEAAALVFRALGYSMPRWAQGAKMASGGVPARLHEALSGPMPLAAISESQLVQVQEPKLPVGASFQEIMTAATRQVVAPRVPEAADFTSEEGFRKELDGAVDVLRSVMVADETRQEPAEFGVFYCARGTATADVTCVAFPEGVDSVKRAVVQDRSGTAQYTWSPVVRSVAVNSLVSAYNRGLIEVQAYAAALNLVKKGLELGSEPLRQWVTTVAERVSALASRAEFELQLAEQLSTDFCVLVPCDGLFDEERRKLIEVIMGQFKDLAPSEVDARPSELTRMREWVSRTAAAGAGEPVAFPAMRVASRASSEVSPAAGRYSGYNVPKFVLYAAGRQTYSGSSGSSSSSKSVTGFRRSRLSGG